MQYTKLYKARMKLAYFFSNSSDRFVVGGNDMDQIKQLEHLT